MKKTLCFFLAACMLLLTGCGKQTATVNTAIRAVIVESPWAVIENNGAEVNPGEDATFHIIAAEGFSLTGTDYTGGTRIRQEGSEIWLTL